MGLNRNPTPGVGRHVLNFSTTAACQICGPFWAISKSTTPSLSDPRGDHAFARALLLLAGLELPCDAARYTIAAQSSTKRGERAAEASLFRSRGRRGPPSCRGCARCRAPADGFRGLPRPTWASPPGHMPRTSHFGALVENSSLKKNLVHFAVSVTKTPRILHDLFCCVYLESVLL